MDLLEMPPPDLLVFLSLTTAAAGSLWTWVAVLTAALAFWRIRAVGSSSDVSPPSPPPSKPSLPVASIETTTPPVSRPTTTSHVENVVGSPKARFTVCYSDERCHVDVGGLEEVINGEESDGDWEVTTPWWEGMTVRRRGDLGWYRYQDRTALNGSVVRLWDEVWGLTVASQRGLY